MRTRLSRFVALLLAAVVASALLTSWAAAQSTSTEGPSTSTPADGVDIGNGTKFTGAVITTPGDTTPRTLNAYQAAVFMQAWLPQALFGTANPVIQDPPAQLPIYRVDVTGTWGSSGKGTQAVYYASDGNTAWISFPDQEVTAAPTTPPPPSHWFQANPRVIGAFNGTESLVQSAGVQAATATTSPPGEARTGSGGSGWVWVALAIGVILLVIAGLFVYRRRTGNGRIAADA